MPETCFINCSQIIGSGITTLIGALVGYHSARRIAKFNARNTAASNLLAVFAPIKSKIRSQKLSSWNEIRPVVQSAYDNHASEFERFRAFVPDRDKPMYDAVCGDYCNVVHSRSITAATRESKERTDAARYLEVLDKVLHFAKP